MPAGVIPRRCSPACASAWRISRHLSNHFRKRKTHHWEPRNSPGWRRNQCALSAGAREPDDSQNKSLTTNYQIKNNSMNINKKWNRVGLVLAGAAIGAGGLLMSQRAIGLENEKAGPPALTPQITAPVRSFSQAFEAVAAQVRPAVVSVYSERIVKMNDGNGVLPFGDGNDLRRFFGQNGPGPQLPPSPGHPSPWRGRGIPEHGMGSGMILDKEGHILTNYHVVKDVDSLKVKLADKRQFDAEVGGTDPKTDIPISHLQGQVPANLPTVK